MRSTLLAAAILLLACFSQPFDGDAAWGRLATGRNVLQNHALSHPADAAMYLAYSAGGFTGVVLVRALVLMLACAIVAYVVWRKARNFYLSLIALFLPAAGAYVFVRDDPTFLLLVLVVSALLSPIVALGAARLPWRPGRLRPRWQWILTIALLAAIALPAKQQRAFRFYAREDIRPMGAARFLIAHHIVGPIFNTPEESGYLMWTLGSEYRVNATPVRDNRLIAYNLVPPGGKTPFQLLDQYGVQAILLTAYDYPSGAPHYLIASLADPEQTQWKLVYQDGQGMVFVRQVPAGISPLANLASLASMEAQCAAHIRAVPSEPLCARETCKLYEHLGDILRARFWMSYYLEHKKRPDPGAETEYQRLSSEIPRPPKAK